MPRENFKKSREGSARLALLEGDAREVCKDAGEIRMDFMFMDAAKGQYIQFLPRFCACGAKDGVAGGGQCCCRIGDVTESRFRGYKGEPHES